jgi:hypothetical protein
LPATYLAGTFGQADAVLAVIARPPISQLATKSKACRNFLYCQRDPPKETLHEKFHEKETYPNQFFSTSPGAQRVDRTIHSEIGVDPRSNEVRIQQ